ncbi:MAG: hypothetical protein KIS94_12265 [Chitinophagales bacterium]|nr:hypothetical protein [Chitinophagales bacterium]
MAANQINPIRRIIAVLKLSKRVGEAIIQARAIVQSMTDNDFFPSPSPALATVTEHIDALETAQIAAQTRAQGTVEARNAALAIVADDLRDLTYYVQNIADANSANSEVIIESAGLQVKRVTPRTTTEFEAKNSPISGTVLLKARAGTTRSSHDWQSSINGNQWTALPSTLQAKTTVTGLNPGNRIYFRHRLVTKDGPQAWSQTISLVVT